MKQSELEHVQCPFYMRSTTITIICEGVLPETYDSIRFEKGSDKTLQFKNYCCGCYEKCERFEPITAKYADH